MGAVSLAPHGALPVTGGDVMIILGILLLAAAVVAAVELILANDGPTISVHLWRWTRHLEPFWLAVAGAAIVVVALLGLSMLRAGGGRARRLRRERRELSKENRQLAKRAQVAESTSAAQAGEHDGRTAAPVEPAHAYGRSEAPAGQGDAYGRSEAPVAHGADYGRPGYPAVSPSDSAHSGTGEHAAPVQGEADPPVDRRG